MPEGRRWRGKKSARHDLVSIALSKGLVRRMVCAVTRSGVQRVSCPGLCAPFPRRPVTAIARIHRVHSRPGGADAPHPPIATSKASHTRAGRGMNQSTPRRLAERCIENSAVVHTNVCSRRSRERRSDRIHSETQRQAAWHFGCTLRARCRQSSEGTARVERTGRAAGGEWHRIIGELEGAIGSRRCAESGKLDTGSSA